MGREKVVIYEHGTVETLDPLEWPSGALYTTILARKPTSHCYPTFSNEDYWKACARLALLSKYGYMEPLEYTKLGDGTRRLDLSEHQVQDIHETWRIVVSRKDKENDLLQFLSSGQSNHRKLRWSVMDCDAGCQFRLHAHPNIELVYCARGSLHGIRMQGEPLTKHFDPGDIPGKVRGPNLASLNRSWGFETIRQGEWLVNEVGSIHKSFTATSGQGALLIVLWGGSHADVAEGEEPKAVNVQLALDHMDEKMGRCDCTEWDTISETFLPASERSK